jgi:hypothetical protein
VNVSVVPPRESVLDRQLRNDVRLTDHEVRDLLVAEVLDYLDAPVEVKRGRVSVAAAPAPLW